MNRLLRLFPLAALRRHIHLLATLLLAVPLLAETEGNFTYSVSNGQATITDFSESYSGDLVIPTTLGGYSVIAIGNSAFYDCSSLTSVTIPASVTTIGHETFENCSSLTSIEIPLSVTFIGERAFQGCSSLTSVAIPDGVTFIGELAFYGCSSLPTDEDGVRYESQARKVLIEAPDSLAGEFVIPASVRFVHSGAFENCSSLTSVKLSESVISIGDYAFSGCSSLPTDENGVRYESQEKKVLIEVPKSCAGLFVIPATVKFLHSDAFSDCRLLTSVTIPKGVTSIGGGAFVGCSSLSSVTIPSSVTTIGVFAFENCSSLTSVTILEGVTSIDWGVFSGCSSLTSVTIPSSVTTIGRHAFVSCTSLTSVTIPPSVTTISKNAFQYCSSLTSVTIPESVTSIDYSAFDSCDSLTSVTFLGTPCEAKDNSFPEGVMGYYPSAYAAAWEAEIVDGMWHGLVMICLEAEEDPPVEAIFTYTVSNDQATITGLSTDYAGDLVIPTSLGGYPVIAIGEDAFGWCDSLVSVKIPEGVTSIGEGAFAYCSSLLSVTIPESVTTIDNHAFYWCNSLTSVTIPSGLTLIDDSVFAGCGLSSVKIPAGVTSIGQWAFDKCALSSVEIPEGVTSIGYGAFRGTALTAVTIPASVTSIGATAFSECYSLEFSVSEDNAYFSAQEGLLFDKTRTTLLAAPGVEGEYRVPEGVTSIGDGAFAYCNLTSVMIPKGVITIGDYAFADCNLTSVTLPEGVTSIGDWAFESCFSLTSVTIPSSVTSIGAATFSGCPSLTISLSADNTCFSLLGGSLFNKEKTTLIAALGVEGEYRVPEGVTSIGDGAFAHCDLTSVTLPEGVTSIGDWAFDSCFSLTSVMIPSSVTSIGEGAFRDCDLTSVTLPEGVTTIGDYAFDGCWRMTSVRIPANVTYIGHSAFRYCTSLTSVTFSGKPCWAYSSSFPAGTQGYYSAAYAAEWEAEIVDGMWHGLVMERAAAEEQPSVPGDSGAIVEGSAETGWVVKPSEGVGEVVVSIPEGVEAGKVIVEVPSTATSVTANGATVKVVKVIGDERHDITDCLDIPAAVAGKVDLTQAEVKAKFAEQILDTSAEGGAVFDPSAKQPLTTAKTKPGLTYILLEGDSLDSLTEGASTVGNGETWTPNPTKRGPSAFYRIRISK